MIETWKGSKVTVGPPYYNAVFMPIALGLLFLMGVGPYIAWRKASIDNLKKNFLMPLIIAAAATLLAFGLGFRSPFSLAGAFVVGFVATTIAVDVGKVSAFFSRRDHVNYLRGFFLAFRGNQRRYAGTLTHFGVLITVVGIIASTVYQTEKVVSLSVGDDFALGAYRVKLVDIHDVQGPNWTAREGRFELYRGDRLLTELRPQKRVYAATQSPTTESAIYAINMGHVFLTMPEVTPEGTATARGVINPLILWVWGGGAIMGIGVLLNMFRPRKRDE
jgi:cytochrome c-type biogenesis protein CcmF